MKLRNPFPALVAVPSPSLDKRIADELRDMMEHLFPPLVATVSYTKDERASWAKVAAEFAGAAEMIIADILTREESGQISEVRRLQLIDALIVACHASWEAGGVSPRVIDRLSREIPKLRPSKARSDKAAAQEEADSIIMYHASNLWLKNPGLSNWAIASKIAGPVDVALAASGLKKRLGLKKPLKAQAIAKRIAKLKKNAKLK
jgi:hypothetical protein